MDKAARASAKRVRTAGRQTAARVDIETRNVARKIAHHGPAELIETMRQRANVSLDSNYAEALCREFGWTPPTV